MKICTKCHVEKDNDEFYGGVKSWCKECFSTYCHERWKVRKLKAVELMGGKCCKCGYNRNLSALDFHHLDPCDKEYNWHQVCKKSWKTILKELSKCILVCKNCHSELHNPKQSFGIIKEITTEGNSSLEGTYRTLIPTGICEAAGCNNDVFGTKYCSSNCSSFSQRKVCRPSKEILQQMYISNSMVSMGKKFGVSDNTIRKWMKSYNILKT